MSIPISRFSRTLLSLNRLIPPFPLFEFRQPGALGDDLPELFGLFGGFKVEVVFANDGLGVASLEGGVADGAEGADGHGNVGMAQDVVAEGEFLPDFAEDAVDVFGRDLGIALDGVFFEPGAEVGLYLDGAALVDLGGAGLDADGAGAEVDVGGGEFADLAVLPVGADAGEECEGEERDEEALGLRGGVFAFGGAGVGFEELHEGFDLIGGEGLGGGAALVDLVLGDLGDGVLGEVALLDAEEAEGVEEAAAVVPGL